MIKSHNQQAYSEPIGSYCSITTLTIPTTLHLHNKIIAHHPRSGLNPIVDAAAYLFTIMGELKTSKSHRPLSKLQKELIQEINTFQESIKNHGYNTEYLLVCHYIICATIDDMIDSTPWGGNGHWNEYSLLGAFNQDVRHQEKFFSIMERTVKEPDYYIDLMELMYVCLSMGYRGRYRSMEQDQTELEQITNSLFKHISAYRGSFSKTLSPVPPKSSRTTQRILRGQESHWTVFLLTACIIMAIFIGLGYLMEMISNEAISKITNIQKSIASDNLQQ